MKLVLIVTMPYYCTVPRCTSMAGKAKNVSFHQFPRDEELAKLWNKILKRGKPYTKYSKVCSLHFTPDDYTMTSGQKNKGQWRTLKKDAIPSRNLPNDSPTPYQRRNSTWMPPSNAVDARMHQQMAQAIYVQTMLAMQVAGITALNGEHQPPSPTEELADPFKNNLTQFDSNNKLNSENNRDSQSNDDSEEENNVNVPYKSYNDTFKCAECSKCFKDPDVFILHKRTHTKKKADVGNTDDMLRANPILANLLKSDSQPKSEGSDGRNIKSIENQIMAALTANMENYLRNLSTIMTSGNTVPSNVLENGNQDDLNCDNEDLNECTDSKLVIDEDV